MMWLLWSFSAGIQSSEFLILFLESLSGDQHLWNYIHKILVSGELNEYTEKCGFIVTQLCGILGAKFSSGWFTNSQCTLAYLRLWRVKIKVLNYFSFTVWRIPPRSKGSSPTTHSTTQSISARKRNLHNIKLWKLAGVLSRWDGGCYKPRFLLKRPMCRLSVHKHSP